ncbi:S9 family peptidase, partial [candidate division KSB1 bacterium]|nr:S9 family peptidase [candidate division KSB1 bacterium]NIR70018.1 S9 family peptidase [candidate division KSB1 bacterium]NIS25167.1 S9 family peptidase [candidate division KSB1 bacterium]NIT72072.1 S9 family peptidase [candidate division KSB1 bacterium]NIU25870.1 S9 family peptidase [candidate division KSB1 bacterium]
MKRRMSFAKRSAFLNCTILLLAGCFVFSQIAIASEVFTLDDLLKLKYVTSAKISPDGERIAYTVRVPRKADDEPGPAYSELHLVSVKTKQSRPFITGKVDVRSIAWRPDGSAIAFLTRRGEKAKKQVWVIPVDGGESRQVTHSETNVLSFKWHPSGDKIAFVANTPKTEREKALMKKGYDFIYFEENLKHRNLYMIDVDMSGGTKEAEQLTEDITVWAFVFSPDGKSVAAGASEKNLVDYRYAFQKVHLLDLESKSLKQLTNNPGKIGNYVFSPDGSHLAYAAALSQKDNAVSQAFVLPMNGGEAINLTPENFRGHVNWINWQDNSTVVYRADEGVETTLSTIKTSGNGAQRQVILSSEDNGGIIFEPPSFTRDFKHMALVGESPEIPGEVYYWQPGKEPQRMTTVNPWLSERTFGKQEAIQYKARDGYEVEGLLIYPVTYQEGQEYPLVSIVHGGPESNYSNGWITRYSNPGQILSGKGYAAFYPNYRSSTGYGVKHAAFGYNDPAGVEFDDIADGIKHLIDEGIADADRVGLGGGSYGGYAAGWFATYYTDLVKATCMFVGISDVISKRGTSDIPYEMLFVHMGEKLEDMWDLSLKRSPIYWAHQSESAILIYGGKADTRVHPSQSMELYRRLKMNNHP